MPAVRCQQFDNRPVKPESAMPKADAQEFAKYYKEYLDKLNSAYVALAQFVEADRRAGQAYQALQALRGH
jgi:hypothetical protein